MIEKLQALTKKVEETLKAHADKEILDLEMTIEGETTATVLLKTWYVDFDHDGGRSGEYVHLTFHWKDNQWKLGNGELGPF